MLIGSPEADQCVYPQAPKTAFQSCHTTILIELYHQASSEVLTVSDHWRWYDMLTFYIVAFVVSSCMKPMKLWPKIDP